MITVSGQLAIKTISSRNGPFNIGRLMTSIGEFQTKGPELEQLKEGMYEGEFKITRIYAKSWSNGSHIGIDTRADLAGMKLLGLDQLSGEEAQKLSPQVVDPVEEDAPPKSSPPAVEVPPTPATPSASPEPVVASTPKGESDRAQADTPRASQADVELFGTLWPLGQVVKLDATVDRRVLRQQIKRLGTLGYEIALDQQWHLKAA
jgi:Protein of unknown function (DUF3275)